MLGFTLRLVFSFFFLGGGGGLPGREAVFCWHGAPRRKGLGGMLFVPVNFAAADLSFHPQACLVSALFFYLFFFFFKWWGQG